ncbi:MAG: nucleotide pyrophosphohydrolase [Acetatifactor sp.]|nr:nucleotide pyrophosphohydrolase [Acetatifactor sp.]
MDHFTFTDMQNIQRELQEKYKDKWGGLSPETAKSTLLWLYGEAGEVGDIIKKKGPAQIMNNEAVRTHFIEELCDVMMYFNDLMLCYDITPEEFERVYREKHRRNMERW